MPEHSHRHQNVGHVTQVIGSTFDAEFPEDQLPAIYNAVKVVADHKGVELNLTGEVQQHLGGGRVRCVALGSTDGLVRGMECLDTGAPVTVPVGKATLGRVFNLLGEPIDGRGPVEAEERWPIHRESPAGDRPVDQDRDVRDGHQGDRPADALRARRQGRAVRRGRPGQDRDPHRADRPHRQQPTAATPSSPASASGPARATTSGWKCRKPRSATPAGSVIEQTCMVFGQMNEPPGARLRVALSALTMAEYFRDTTGADMLLFIDNIFRFSQAGSEVSALLGRMPSAVGYQPTLATEMGALQERIASTSKGAITSVQAVYVPADDPTDPAPATAFGQLDAFIYLERSITEKGIYPAVDPLASSSRDARPAVRRRAALRDRPPRADGPCSATANCRTSSPSSASTS